MITHTPDEQQNPKNREGFQVKTPIFLLKNICAYPSIIAQGALIGVKKAGQGDLLSEGIYVVDHGSKESANKMEYG